MLKLNLTIPMQLYYLNTVCFAILAGKCMCVCFSFLCKFVCFVLYKISVCQTYSLNSSTALLEILPGNTILLFLLLLQSFNS